VLVIITVTGLIGHIVYLFGVKRIKIGFLVLIGLSM